MILDSAKELARLVADYTTCWTDIDEAREEAEGIVSAVRVGGGSATEAEKTAFHDAMERWGEALCREHDIAQTLRAVFEKMGAALNKVRGSTLGNPKHDRQQAGRLFEQCQRMFSIIGSENERASTAIC